MKMLKKDRKQRVSGFTLLEMMVVIAIISILVAVLVPTVRNYLTRSRLHTANSQAKVLFNSMQTIMQEYEFRERGMKESAIYGAAKSGDLLLYVQNGTINKDQFGSGSVAASLDDDILGTNFDSAPASSIGARISRIYTDYLTTTWCVKVKDYSVQGVLCASSANTPYIGGYPLQPSVKGAQCEGVSLTRLSSVSAADLDTYCTEAWKPAPAVVEEAPEEG